LFSTPEEKKGLAMRKCVALLALCVALFSAGCTGGAFSGGPASPTREHIVAMAALLPPQQAEELRVWGKEHRNVWNGDVHSGKTCPIFVYTPAFYRHAAGQMSDLEWAEFLHKLYKYKHREEGHCDCDELLGVVKPAPAPAPVPAPVPSPAPAPVLAPPTAPPTPAPDKDKEKYDAEEAIKELLRKYLEKHAGELPAIVPK